MSQNQPTPTAQTRRTQPVYKPQRPQPQSQPSARRGLEHVAVLGYN